MDDIASKRAAYAAYLGDRFAQFELVAENLAAAREAYPARSRGDWLTYTNIRDLQMYENFRKQYDDNPPGKYFGQFGTAHSFRAPLWGRTWLAGHMARGDSPVSGRVLSIVFAYVDSVWLQRSVETGEWRTQLHTDSEWCPPPMADVCPDDQLVLFKLIGPGSPFDTYRVNRRMAAGTTEYFQFLLLVRGAKPAAPGEWN
jgi:hypothetical protein